MNNLTTATSTSRQRPVYSVAAQGAAARLLATTDGTTSTVTTISSAPLAEQTAQLLNRIAERSVGHVRDVAYVGDGDVSSLRRDVLAVFAAGTTGRDVSRLPAADSVQGRDVHELGRLLAGQNPPVRAAVADTIGHLYDGYTFVVIVDVSDYYETVQPVRLDLSGWLPGARDDDLRDLLDGDGYAVIEWLVDVTDEVEPVRLAARMGDNGWVVRPHQRALRTWVAAHRPHLLGN